LSLSTTIIRVPVPGLVHRLEPCRRSSTVADDRHDVRFSLLVAPEAERREIEVEAWPAARRPYSYSARSRSRKPPYWRDVAIRSRRPVRILAG
jgi:hypothetical protein